MRMRDALGEAQTGNRRLRGRAFGFSWIRTFQNLTEFAQLHFANSEKTNLGVRLGRKPSRPMRHSPTTIELTNQIPNKRSSQAMPIVLDRVVQMW